MGKEEATDWFAVVWHAVDLKQKKHSRQLFSVFIIHHVNIWRANIIDGTSTTKEQQLKPSIDFHICFFISLAFPHTASCCS